MQVNSQKQQRGVSLIELLLVLVIIAAIVVAGLYRYKQYALDKDLAIVRENVASLFNNLDIYYAQLAANPDTYHKPICNRDIDVSKRALQANNLWPDFIDVTSLVRNKNDDYEVESTSITIDSPPPNMPESCVYNHKLLVMVKMHVEPKILNWYAQMLGASVEGGNDVLTWEKMPSFSVQGTSSHLWILGSGLAVFKKAMQTGT